MSRCSRSHAPDAARPSRRSRRFLWPCARKFASPPSKWALEWEGTSSLLNEIYQSLDPIAFSSGLFLCAGTVSHTCSDLSGAALVLMSTGEALAGARRLGCAHHIHAVRRRGRHRGRTFRVRPVLRRRLLPAAPCRYLRTLEGGHELSRAGLIGALLSGIVAAHFTHIPYLTLADLGCIGAPIGLFFGRCANFVNGELWGAPTDVAWGRRGSGGRRE